jgi:hypothetical protein
MYRKSSNELSLLKFFVYTMGLVLMVGTITLTYIIYKRNIPVLKEFQKVEKKQEAVCENLASNFTFDSEVIQINETNNKLILLTKPQSGTQQIIIFDYCKNKIINNLYIDIKSKKTGVYHPKTHTPQTNIDG